MFNLNLIMRKQSEKKARLWNILQTNQPELFTNVSVMKDPHTHAHAHTHTYTHTSHIHKRRTLIH